MTDRMFVIGIGDMRAALILLGSAGAAALAMGAVRAVRLGIGKNRVLRCTLLMPLLVWFCSHALHGLTTLGREPVWQALFCFWQQGQSVYGGLLGIWLAVLLCGGRDALRLGESYAPSAALMMAAARVAEGMCGAGYGEYWLEEENFLCRLPLMMYDADYECWAWALFTAEALLALILFAVLAARKAKRPDGLLLFTGLYAAGQLVLESLRRDDFLRWGFVRVDEVFSAAAVIAVLAAFAVLTRERKRPVIIAGLTAAVLMLVLCTLLEFATEKRIPFLRFLDVDGCYGVMAGACAVLAADVLWMRKQCPIDAMELRR